MLYLLYIQGSKFHKEINQDPTSGNINLFWFVFAGLHNHPFSSIWPVCFFDKLSQRKPAHCFANVSKNTCHLANNDLREKNKENVAISSFCLNYICSLLVKMLIFPTDNCLFQFVTYSFVFEFTQQPVAFGFSFFPGKQLGNCLGRHSVI